MKIRSIVILLLALGTLVLAACSSQESATTPIEPAEVTLNATDIAFDQNRIEVAAGRPVSLTLHNAGVLEHDFTIIEMPHDGEVSTAEMEDEMGGHDMSNVTEEMDIHVACLLYTSDAADERSSVDLGGRRIIKKKTKRKKKKKQNKKNTKKSKTKSEHTTHKYHYNENTTEAQ